MNTEQPTKEQLIELLHSQIDELNKNIGELALALKGQQKTKE